MGKVGISLLETKFLKENDEFPFAGAIP